MGPARAIRQVTKRRVRLGRTGLTVSTLCFGTGYMGGSVASGARLLTRAYDLGITFWDASDDYGTHPHVSQPRSARAAPRALRGGCRARGGESDGSVGEGCLPCRADGGGAAALPEWSRRVRHEGPR